MVPPTTGHISNALVLHAPETVLFAIDLDHELGLEGTLPAGAVVAAAAAVSCTTLCLRCRCGYARSVTRRQPSRHCQACDHGFCDCQGALVAGPMFGAAARLCVAFFPPLAPQLPAAAATACMTRPPTKAAPASLNVCPAEAPVRVPSLWSHHIG